MHFESIVAVILTTIAKFLEICLITMGLSCLPLLVRLYCNKSHNLINVQCRCAQALIFFSHFLCRNEFNKKSVIGSYCINMFVNIRKFTFSVSGLAC